MSKTRQVAEDCVELKSSSISRSVERLIRKESTAWQGFFPEERRLSVNGKAIKDNHNTKLRVN